MNPVRQMRLAVTAADYEAALVFYRDVLGLREEATFTSNGGRVTILDAGRATLELADPPYAEFIDEVEVGRRVAGHIRVAFEVDDVASATQQPQRAEQERSPTPFERRGTHSTHASKDQPASS